MTKKKSHADNRQGQGGGRPRKSLSEDDIIQVESLASVLSSEQIADYFGICRTTFYEIMKNNTEVSERYKRGRAKAIGSVAKSLLTKAQSGDTPSMIFYLKTQAGWKETQVVDHSSTDGTMTPKAEMTDEQMRVKLEKFGIAVKP